MEWSTILRHVGNTPLVRLQRVVAPDCATILGKLESRNPSGSVKDRAALAMVEDAEARGVLRPDSTVVEPSSGNMGIALAMVCVAKGYRLVITMPENAPAERRRLLSRYGVELRLTDVLRGMDGAVSTAQEMAASDPSIVYLDQFRNAAVVRFHRETTAQEVVRQVGGTIHAFVAGVGTGGTLTGVGEVLKARDPSVQVVAVEPTASPMLSRGESGPHSIAGIGPDFVPPLLNRTIVDEVVSITDDVAIETAHRLARQEGLLVGPSSGAAVAAALQIGQRLGPDKVVVTILADTGERYMAL